MSYILYGAGAAGRYALKHLRARGEEPLCFVDTDRAKFGTLVEGLMVCSPMQASDEWPEAEWVACAISRPAATEIRAAMRELGVPSVPLWQCIEVCHGLPSKAVQKELCALTRHDPESAAFVRDQYSFRQTPDYDEQIDPSPMSELYFPPFIGHLDDENFVDCGACDGDTVKTFIERWKTWERITAFEPDPDNFQKMFTEAEKIRFTYPVRAAVSDTNNPVHFHAVGNYSSHIGEGDTVDCYKLDDFPFFGLPTYIKFDIEGAELDALWGARRILKEHSPVLAVCAYHTSDHLWEIPLLIHAIQPNYKLFFRRYGEGAFETVWYAVPPERVIPRVPATHESYSDNHEG